MKTKISKKIRYLIIADLILLTVGAILVLIGVIKDNDTICLFGIIFTLAESLIVGWLMAIFSKKLNFYIMVGARTAGLIALLGYFLNILLLTYIFVGLAGCLLVFHYILIILKRKNNQKTGDNQKD